MTKRQRPRPYVNAVAVLPEPLIQTLQQYVAGCYVWVPTLAARTREARDAVLVQRRQSGETVRSIAADLGITERRVYQVLARRP